LCPGAEDIKAKVTMLKERGKKYQELLTELEDSDETQVSLTDPDSRAMLNNHRVEICYNVQTVVDSKHKLVIDHEVTNEATDSAQLSLMSKRAKEILGTEELEVLADKGYYNAVEIKECVDNGITPYIPEPASTVPRDVNIPEPGYYKDKFRYDAQQDVYICPGGSKLTFRGLAPRYGKVMRLYKSKDCQGCLVKGRCTRDKSGRTIFRWEHEDILEEMRRRVQANKEKTKLRQQLSEHPFGTIKRSFNQGYMLLKGLEKAGTEVSLTILAYNIKRAINIIGLKGLIMAVG